MGRDITTGELVCGSCGADSVIQIELTLADGTEVSFFSCHRCESRWWNRDGQALALDAVLDLARRPRAS
jgi:transposase-like protein